MFCLLVVLVRFKLSVPVQVTDWKVSSPKGSIMCMLTETLNVTHSVNK